MLAACQVATVYPNPDRELVQFAVQILSVLSGMARTVMVLIAKALTASVQNAILIDLVLNEALRIADSRSAKDVRNFPDVMVVQAARSAAEADHYVAAAGRCVEVVANWEVLQPAVEARFAAGRKHVAVRFVVVAVHTTETVSQRAARASKARRVHDYVSAFRPNPE